MNESSVIYIAGNRGLAGSAMERLLKSNGYSKIVTRSHSELDLTDGKEVDAFFSTEKPDVVILFAAKVGGIYANKTYPADFICQNIAIESNVINSALKHGVNELVFIASGTIYPSGAEQPLKEESMLSGAFDKNNEPYALAKVCGIKMCDYISQQYGKNYFTIVPCNLYGPGDHYDPMNSHVIPGMIRKFHEAKENNAPFVELWGTGSPVREFLYSEDLADACFHLLTSNTKITGHINIGSGVYTSISELAKTISEVVGYSGEIKFNTDMPDGAPMICLDTKKIRSYGWKPKTDLKSGLVKTYADFLKIYGTFE